MNRYALGLDYGTNSCRSLIVDLNDGTEIAGHVYAYPSGVEGILSDPRAPNLARQNPQDYLSGLVVVVREAIRAARAAIPAFDPSAILGIGIDTTGSTPIPVDREGTPLALLPEFHNNMNAMAWLWKDHTSHAEAAEITSVAAAERPRYLAKCGGIYSSEWFWSKILRMRRVAPDVFNAAWSVVECCDYLPAVLAGNTRPDQLARSMCAAGHKALYSREWGGLPDAEFLARLHPDLPGLRERLYAEALTSDRQAGKLCDAWAAKLGLKPGIAVATGAFDAHMGAVGAGIKTGTLAKILGTSTCDLLVWPNNMALADIPGVCGIVDGSVLPGHFGIEAGQSAVGDIFLWFVNHLVPDSYGATQADKFLGLNQAAASIKPGASGLLALDWNNGNRCVLVDSRLSGLLLGQSLQTTAHEVYRALIEATAFGGLTIIKRIEEYGVPVNDVVNCGGLASRNPLLMQIYADVTARPMKVSRSDQTCALGAAIFGAVAAGRDVGGFDSVADAQAVLCGVKGRIYKPAPERSAVYAELYKLYNRIHDAFGTKQDVSAMHGVMKDLLAIRDRQRA